MPATRSSSLPVGVFSSVYVSPTREVLVLGPALVDEHRAVGEVGQRPGCTIRMPRNSSRRPGRWPAMPKKSPSRSAEPNRCRTTALDAVDLAPSRSAMVGENALAEHAADDVVADEVLLDRLVDADALAESPRIAIVQARASPIISADAVAVVRRGLRSEFWPARLPTVPNTRAVRPPGPRAQERPADHRAGRRHAEQDDEDAAADAASRRAGTSVNSPAPSAAAPTRDAARRPSSSRRWSEVSGSAMSSRSACTGAIRAVRRAGQPRGRHRDDDADDVRRDARSAGRRSAADRTGRARSCANSARMPIASSTPRPSPSVEPTTPTHERLEQHRPGHLPLGRAEGAQQRELAAALGDQDRERVDDQERADDQGDARRRSAGRCVRKLIASSRSDGRLVGGVVAGDRLVRRRGARRPTASRSSSWETPSSAVTQMSV